MITLLRHGIDPVGDRQSAERPRRVPRTLIGLFKIDGDSIVMFCDAEDPAIRAIIEIMDRNEIPPNTPIHRYDSCARCGRLGHTAVSCSDRIPSAGELQAAITTNLARVVSSAPPTWKSDTFGLFLPAGGEPIAPAGSGGHVFCLNCGEAGHAADDCREPTFADLLRLMEEMGIRASE